MKRIIDITLSLLSLFVSLPILILLYFLIKLNMGPPVFFVQPRLGLNGKPFSLIKFRTMLNIDQISDKQLTDGQRITRLGKFLRSASLDELPELINILRGEMSLVGPRPLLLEYLHKFTPQQAKRLEVLPGLTGLAQVNGRNLLSWEDKFKFDVMYVENQNIILDLIIILKTIRLVFNRNGIRHKNSETMPPFTGQ